MKKIYSILGLALGMLAVGCTTDSTEDLGLDHKVVLGVNIEESRTSLGDLVGTQHPILWSEGDKINVNNRTSQAVPLSYVGTSNAEFTVSSVRAPYRVIYPANIYNSTDGTITVPSVQEYTAGSFANGVAVMVGYSETAQISLKNLYSFVKIPIEKGDEVALSSVSITALGGEAISGVFAIDFQGATIAPVAGQDIIRIEGDLAYVEDVVEVVIAIPAGTYSAGFKVNIVDANGATMEKTAYTASGITVPAGMLLNMPKIQYYGNVQEGIVITTAAQLQNFLSAVEAGDYSAYKRANGEVILGSDIDLSDVTLTPPTADFAGVFNGQGYALKNWNTTEGLFTSNSGTIKNIVIDESCSLNLPIISAASVIGFIVDSNTGLVSGITNNAPFTLNHEADLAVQYKAAPIVGYSSGSGKISNCVNNGDLTIFISNITAGSNYFGGIVANTSMGAAANIAVENCVNNGNITVDIPGQNKNLYLGGVIGAGNNKGVLNHCVNTGSVSYNFPVGNSGAYPNMGGIVGYTACTMNYCKNYGDVTFTSESESVTRPAVAGVAGYVSKDVAYCENHGAISVTGNKFAKASSATNGGVGGEQWPAVGGCFGCVGSVASNGRANTDHCINTGSVTVYAPYTSCRAGVGGVVGEPCGALTNCSNSGDIEVTYGSQAYIGGIAGYIYYISDRKAENLENTGNILFHRGSYHDDSTISSAAYNYIGGIIGSLNSYTNYTANNLVNHGEVKSDANLPVLIGGVYGCMRGVNTNCYNYGNVISENNLGVKVCCVAGFAGFGGGSAQNCGVECDIEVISPEESVSVTPFVGVVGNTEALNKAVTINVNITSETEQMAVLVGAQSNNQKTITLGTEEEPIVIKNLTFNGDPVTAENIGTQYPIATYTEATEEANNVANLVYTIGSTIVFE